MQLGTSTSMGNREQDIQLLEQRAEAMRATISSLRIRVDEAESFLFSNSIDIDLLIEAVEKVFRPIVIRFRAHSGKTHDEVMSELEQQIRLKQLDAAALATGLLTVEFSPGSPLILSQGPSNLGVDRTTLKDKFLTYVSRLEDRKTSEILNSATHLEEMRDRLTESEAALIEVETQLAKLRPKEASDLSPTELADLSANFKLPNLSPDETLDQILEELPFSLSEALSTSGLTATVAIDKPAELVLIHQVKLKADAVLGRNCKQCSELEPNCTCDYQLRLSKTMAFLLEETGATWETIQAAYWENFFPYFYLNRSSGLAKIGEQLENDASNLGAPLVELLTRMLFGDVLNPYWFRNEIERSQTASNERLALNQWTKSTLGMTLPELSDQLHTHIPALSRDEELPIAWLLSTTDFGHSFGEELLTFLTERLAQ